MGGRGVIEEFFSDGVPVEPGDGTQASGDSGPGPAAGFQVTGETLDVGTACLEQSQMICSHQDAYWRRSSAYASRVRPV
jgi:hypothetical protein